MQFQRGSHADADAFRSADAKYEKYISSCICTSHVRSMLTPFEGKTPSYLFLKPFPFFKSKKQVFEHLLPFAHGVFRIRDKRGCNRLLDDRCVSMVTSAEEFQEHYLRK